MKSLWDVCANCEKIYGFYFLVREAKLLKYFRLITNYFLDFVRDKNLKARMSCFSTMKDRCLNYLACNRDIHALFPLSWLSYSAFHDASSSNFDGKLDWKFFRFSVRSLQSLFHFLIKVLRTSLLLYRRYHQTLYQNKNCVNARWDNYNGFALSTLFLLTPSEICTSKRDIYTNYRIYLRYLLFIQNFL